MNPMSAMTNGVTSCTTNQGHNNGMAVLVVHNGTHNLGDLPGIVTIIIICFDHLT